MAWLHFTLVTVKGQCQGHSDCEDLYVIISQDWSYVTSKTVIEKHTW